MKNIGVLVGILIVAFGCGGRQSTSSGPSGGSSDQDGDGGPTGSDGREGGASSSCALVDGVCSNGCCPLRAHPVDLVRECLQPIAVIACAPPSGGDGGECISLEQEACYYREVGGTAEAFAVLSTLTTSQPDAGFVDCPNELARRIWSFPVCAP